MSYLDVVRLTADQRIDEDGLQLLTTADWKEWMEDQLHGVFKIDSLSGPTEAGYERYYSLFMDVIPYLPEQSRIRAYEAITQCLDEAYLPRKNSQNKRDRWNDQSLDELLLLVGGVDTEPERGEEIQDGYFRRRADKIVRFLDVVEPKPSFELVEEEPDLYFRVLQALCGADVRLPYEFWYQQLLKSPDVYAMPCFDGASLNSPYDAIRLLPHIFWENEKTRDRMRGEFVYFFARYRRDEAVISSLYAEVGKLPPSVFKLLSAAESRK